MISILKVYKKVVNNDELVEDEVYYYDDAYGNLINLKSNYYIFSFIYDDNIQLYYCKSRFYRSKLRRWISPDNSCNLSVDNTQNLNLFAYCLNNPVM